MTLSCKDYVSTNKKLSISEFDYDDKEEDFSEFGKLEIKEIIKPIKINY